MAEQAAQVQIAKTQADAAVSMQQKASELLGIRQETLRTVVIAAAGVVGILAFGFVMVKLRAKPKRMRGYRRRYKRSRR